MHINTYNKQRIITAAHQNCQSSEESWLHHTLEAMPQWAIYCRRIAAVIEDPGFRPVGNPLDQVWLHPAQEACEWQAESSGASQHHHPAADEKESLFLDPGPNPTFIRKPLPVQGVQK